MTVPRFLWIPQVSCCLWLWVFLLQSVVLLVSCARNCLLLSAASWPVGTWFILTQGLCLWNSGEAVGRWVCMCDIQIETQHSFSLLVTRCLVHLSVVTFLCGSQSLYVWCPLSASRLPIHLPPSCFPIPSEAPFTPVYYTDQFHTIESHRFAAQKKLAEDSEFQPLFSPL